MCHTETSRATRTTRTGEAVLERQGRWRSQELVLFLYFVLFVCLLVLFCLVMFFF